MLFRKTSKVNSGGNLSMSFGSSYTGRTEPEIHTFEQIGDLIATQIGHVFKA